MVDRPMENATAITVSRRRMLAMLAGTGAAASGFPAIAQTPRRGGRIRVATISSSTEDTLDPAKGAVSTDYCRGYMIYSGLTQFDEHLTPQLALAESLETSDQTVWRIRLRAGVQFHDGKELGPADVVYSLLRHKQPATISKVKTIADQIES